MCTEIACPPSDPCCNACSSGLGFTESVEQGVYFQGNFEGKSVGCSGNECEMQCHPFERGETVTVRLAVGQDERGNLFFELLEIFP